MSDKTPTEPAGPARKLMAQALQMHIRMFPEAAVIELTESAVAAVRTAIQRAQGPVEGIRIMVQAGGCAGLKYMMGLVPEPAPDDIVIERGGIKLFIDAESGFHMAGTTMDFVTGVERSGFSFSNPNAAAKCACGKSFS
jgi:iron-sulfur cluster assembly accessory protein